MKAPVSRASALSELCRVVAKKPAERRAPRACNLCSKPFIPRGRFHLFCDHCRSVDELFKFHDWLPALV